MGQLAQGHFTLSKFHFVDKFIGKMELLTNVNNGFAAKFLDLVAHLVYVA